MSKYTLDEAKAIANIKPGVTVWRVMGFVQKKQATISELLVNGSPFVSKNIDSIFVPAHNVEHNYNTQFSIRDAGFPSGNNYNDHKLFFNKLDAEQYAQDIRDGKGVSRKKFFEEIYFD